MVLYEDRKLSISELRFETNNMIWWTVDSVFVDQSTIEKHFEEEILFYNGNLHRVSDDVIIVLQDCSVEELEDALLKTRDYRVLVISKMTLQTFQSMCLTQYLKWYSPLFVDSQCKLNSYLYYLESQYFGERNTKWLPCSRMMARFDSTTQQSNSLRYLIDMNRYITLFISKNDLNCCLYDKQQQALHWKELLMFPSFLEFAKTIKTNFRNHKLFLKLFNKCIIEQTSNFNKVTDLCSSIIEHLAVLECSIATRFQFVIICTDIHQVSQFTKKVKDEALLDQLQLLISMLETLYSTPFYELFVIDNVEILDIFHVNMIEDIKRDLNQLPEFVLQFDKTGYSRLFQELFQTLKEMPMDANLYDTLIAFCVRCDLDQDSKSRLQFEMLIRDFENIGILSLTAKRDHVQKNLLYFT